MNKILDILDSMEMTRLIAEKNPEEFTVDAVIREFSDMLAGAFGYKNREEGSSAWKNFRKAGISTGTMPKRIVRSAILARRIYVYLLIKTIFR